MASENLPPAARRRSIVAAVLALLLFFSEQSLLAETVQTSVNATVVQPFTIGGGAQWLLTGSVLVVSWAFFFAVVRGISVPRR
jgi:hypothetical protein